MLAEKYLKSNVFVLMAGTLLSQLLPFLISPILTRLYTPEEFGTFGLYFSISMIISVFITGRYEMAIILPKSDNASANVVGLSLLITVVVSAAVFLITIFLKHSIAILFNSDRIENILFLLPLTMLAIGSYQTFNYWNNRKEHYKRLAVSSVARSVSSSAASVAFGFTSFKAFGLIVGDTIGQLIASFFLFIRTWRNDKTIFKGITKKGMREQALRYQHFPKFNVASGLSEKLSGHIPVLMLSGFFGEAITGLFSLSQRIVAAPGAIIARAVGDVFRKQATVEYQVNGNCIALFNKTFRQLTFLGFMPFSVFSFLRLNYFHFCLVKSGKWPGITHAS